MPPGIYRTVVEAATGRREPSEEDLERIAEHVAEAGFDPDYAIPADERIEGLFDLEGKPVREGTLLRSADYHYLVHVRRRREWPEGTTQEDYERSIRGIVADPDTGILVSRYRDQGWQLSFLRKSRELEGPGGHEWVLVEYNLNYDSWTTALQPTRGPAYLDEAGREDEKWLREPAEKD